MPAVSLAAAAPAFAISTETGRLAFRRGVSGVDEVEESGEIYYDLHLVESAISVDVVAGDGLPTGLVLTVTYVNDDQEHESPNTFLLHGKEIPEWKSESDAGEVDTAFWEYSGVFADEADEAPLEGLLCGTDFTRKSGQFVLHFSAPGYQALSVSFATPGPTQQARGLTVAQSDRRPRSSWASSTH